MKHSKAPLLAVEQLTVTLGEPGARRRVLDGVDLAIAPGEKVALIGESGSGKSLLAKSLVDLLPPACRIESGTIYWRGDDIRGQGDRRASLRGYEISLLFQEPLSSLNPALKVGLQLRETLALAGGRGAALEEQARALLARVRLPSPAEVMRQYPHELSGGMRQRVMIAIALALKPALLIADEPTTALDMVVRREMMALMAELARESGSAVLIISHDLGSVADVADRVHVMREGRIVEHSSLARLLRAPRSEYTRSLLAALPQPREHALENPLDHPLDHPLDNPPDHPPGEPRRPARPVLSVEGVSVSFPRKGGSGSPFSRDREIPALDDISFEIQPGETLAIIGESGSGKTTLGRVVAGLQPPGRGRVALSAAARHAGAGRLQAIFQDPADALNPRFRVGRAIAEGLLADRTLNAAIRRARVREALQQVGLDPALETRWPHELSGGQKQRVCIARAIAPRPDFILADEPVAALDVTVQKQILELFQALKAQLEFACLFVSHDLGVVEHIADRVGVLYRGRLVEIGPTGEVFNAPRHAYTRQLLAATTCLLRESDAGGTRYRLGHRLAPGTESADRRAVGT